MFLLTLTCNMVRIMQVFTKRCSSCKEVLPENSFYKSSSSKDGLYFRCKLCDKKASQKYKKENYQKDRELRRSERRKRVYGLSEHDVKDLFDKQKGLCACCEKPLSDEMGRLHAHNKMVIDHDHQTGYLRGLLCTMCNKGIGLLGDNLEGLKKAVNYLSKREVH